MEKPFLSPQEIHKWIESLPHELHEWIEIQVGKEGDLIWIGGLYSPGGAGVRYEHAHIGMCSTMEEAIKIGESLARTASAARLIMSVPKHCTFTVQPGE